MKLILAFMILAVSVYAIGPGGGGTTNNGGITLQIIGGGKEYKLETVLTGLLVGETEEIIQTNVFNLVGPDQQTFLTGTASSDDWQYLNCSYELYVRTIPAAGESLVGNSFVANGGASENGPWLFVDSGYYSKMEPGVFTQPQPFHSTTGNTVAHSTTPDNYKTLWLVDDTSLTADLFREGVDKMVLAAATPGETTSTGGGMTLEDFAGTNTEDIAALQKNYYDNPKSAPTFNDDGAGAAAKEQTELAFSDRDTPSVGTAPSASNTGMVLRLPISAGGDISYDPENYPWLKSWASWFKASIAWLITILFQIWLWNYFKEIYYTLAGTQQAKGNPIVGGTGAQATSLVAALLITAVIVSLPGLFWAMADSGLGWSATISVNPATLATGQQFLNVGLYIFTYFFPLGTALAALSSYFVILRGGLILIAGMQSLIRFFVP